MAGRGVDILLGGNPEGLARQDVLKEGFDPQTLLDEFALPVALELMPPDFWLSCYHSYPVQTLFAQLMLLVRFG